MRTTNSPLKPNIVFWTIVLFLLFGSIAAAQKKFISEVEIKGLITVSENEIKTKLETQAGKPLSPITLRNDIQRLHSLGYFSNIQVRQIPVPTQYDQIKIIFLVEENQLLGEIYIAGNFNMDKEKIMENLRIAKEKYLDQYALSLDILNIKDMYKKEGYLFVDIQQEKKAARGWVDLHLIIDEGPEVEIYEIKFFGNNSYSNSDLLAFTQTQESGIFSSKHYDEDTFQEDLILIRNYYRSEGYLDVQVEVRDIFFSNGRTEATINISVKEGPRYHIGKIVFEGNEIFRDAELKNRLELAQEEPFLQTVMLEDKSRLERLYGENGFLDVRVNPVVSIVDLKNPVVDIVYKITEGDTTYIRKIGIKGNVLTQEKVIRREMLIVPGELFNMGKMEASQQRLRRLRYFESIKVDISETDHEKWKDLTISVEEGRTGSLRFAAGITSDLGAVGEISLTKRNFDVTALPASFSEFFSGESFTGAGQNLDIFFQAGKELLRFKISFVEPYFMDYNLILGTDVYRTERARESWDEGRTGGQISLGKRIALDTTFRVSYRLEEVKISDVDLDAAPDVYFVKGKTNLSSATAEFTIDTRDDFILPTRGYILGASYEVAGVFLGGDHDYSKANFRFAWFQTMYTTDDNFKHVLSLGGRVGMADEHRDSPNVPIFERFFAGGSTSIRGFEFRTVGPRHVNNDPLGGEFMVLGTVEYGFPIYKDVLRGVLFTDVGNVIPRIDSTILDDLRVSIGFGFRLKVPILGPRPFAFDFGFPIRKEDEDETQVFSFSFGKPF